MIRILILSERNIFREKMRLLCSGHLPETDLHFATDCLEVQNTARQIGPDLVILDAAIQSNSTTDHFILLREDLMLRHIPILVAGSGSNPSFRQKALEMAVEGFIDEPYDPPAAVTLIRSLARMGNLDRKQAEAQFAGMSEKMTSPFPSNNESYSTQELQQAMESLQESEERFHSLFFNHSAVMLLVNPLNGRIVDANQAARNFYGYRFDQEKPIYISELNVLSDEQIRSEMEFAVKRNVNYFEFRHRLSTGEIRTVEVHSSPVKVGDEMILFSIIHDITQRKIAEKSLLWNESLLKKMTSSSPLAFLVVDNRTDEIIYFNHRFCEIWEIEHLEADMLKGLLKNNDIIPDCLPVLMDIPTFAESCKPLQSEENRIVLEDEIHFTKSRTIRRFTAQIRDEQDNYHGRLYIFEDISHRKQTEEFIRIQFDLATNLSNCKDLEEALTLSMQSLMEFQGVDGGGIYLLNEGTLALNLAVHHGLSQAFVSNVSEIASDDPRTRIVRSGQTVWGPVEKVVGIRAQWQEEIKGLAVIPIIHDGNSLGCLNLCSITEANFFDLIQHQVTAIAFLIGGAISRFLAANALVKSRKNFELLFDTIDDFLFILDIHGNIIHSNRVTIERLGYTAEELSGMHVLAVHPPERREEAGFIVGEMMAGRQAYCPVPLYTKSGNMIPVETKVVPGKWDDKDVLFGISRDITERQKAEAALRIQSSAFESFALAIIITDIAGKIQWANSAFFRLSGYNAEEVKGKHCGNLIKSGKMDKAFYKELWSTILKGKVWDGELINKRKDGSIYDEEMTITPVFDHEGKVVNFIAIKIDITSRKEMEMALRESEARWNFALESSGDGVWDWNLQTNEVFFSEKYKTMLGYEADEITNHISEWETRIHPEDREQIYAALNLHLSGKQDTYRCEHRLMCKDESYKWILTRGKIITTDKHNNPIRIIGTHTDITERILLEQSLRAVIEKEKDLNDLKSRFVSMASHEFRTPLASILLTSETVINYQERMDQQQIGAKLTNIRQHAMHLTNVVNDLMQLSKINEGRVPFDPRNVDLIALCKSTVDIFRNDSKGGELIDFTSDFEKLVMFLDQRLITQVLNNLISNAVKYTPEDPKIKIHIYREGEEIMLSVEDNGIGIPKEDQKFLFQPFYRATNAIIIQGNGLGLNIVRESIRLHAGEITFKSAKGKGSVFYIHLPGELIAK